MRRGWTQRQLDRHLPPSPLAPQRGARSAWEQVYERAAGGRSRVGLYVGAGRAVRDDAAGGPGGGGGEGGIPGDAREGARVRAVSPWDFDVLLQCEPREEGHLHRYE